MNKYPATFKKKSYEENYGGKRYKVNLFYEYRGHEYMITDERNGYSEPMWVKHKNEQERIDRIIDLENRPSVGKPTDWNEIARLFED